MGPPPRKRTPTATACLDNPQATGECDTPGKVLSTTCGQFGCGTETCGADCTSTICDDPQCCSAEDCPDEACSEKACLGSNCFYFPINQCEP